MIIPISHERMTARRWPIVTTIVFALCLLVQAVWPALTASADARIEGANREVNEYYADHPYLLLPADTTQDDMDKELAKLQQEVAALSPGPAPDDETRRAEQGHLDELRAAV